MIAARSGREPKVSEISPRNMFEISPRHNTYIRWLGSREVPLFCIDNVFVDPDAVRRFAFQRDFPTSQAYYPGRHQPLSPRDPAVAAFCTFLANVLSRATGKLIKPSAVVSDFSILTTPEEQLLGLQGQPHIDGTPMLGVIYLNDSDFGGTVFFRNRATNSMKVVTPKEKEHYAEITKEQHQAVRRNKYIVDSDADWEKVEIIDGIKNRLVIWPGNVFHAIQVKVPPDQGKLAEKRLTQRVIVNSIQ